MENTTSKTESATALSNNGLPREMRSIFHEGADEPKFKHPPIIMDLLFCFKQWYGMHQHLPKLFRITISTKMLEAISECIELCVIINFGKKSGNELAIGREKLLELGGKIELLKAYALVSWEMKFISHGFYGQYSERLENISKQSAAWHGWFVNKFK